MSDLERARNFVAEQGYEFIWRSPDGYEEVWRKGNVDVSLDEISEKADITVPLSDLPSILSSLTLEDVERALTAAFCNALREGRIDSLQSAESIKEWVLVRLGKEEG